MYSVINNFDGHIIVDIALVSDTKP